MHNWLCPPPARAPEGQSVSIPNSASNPRLAKPRVHGFGVLGCWQGRDGASDAAANTVTEPLKREADWA